MRTFIISKGFYAIFLFSLQVPVSWACMCKPTPPPNEALNKSDAVFLATVDKIGKNELTFEIFLRVHRVWKGNITRWSRIYTSTEDSICGYNFQPNKTYLIYATQRKDTGELATNICTRTNPFDPNCDDIARIGEGVITSFAKTYQTARIGSGTIVLDNDRFIPVVEDCDGCAGQKVYIYRKNLDSVPMASRTPTPIFSSTLTYRDPPLGVWFAGIYADCVIFDLGTSAGDRGYAIFDIPSHKNVASFTYVKPPKIKDGHLMATIRDPKLSSDLLEHAPFRRSVSEKEEKEAGILARKAYIADIDVDLVKQTAQYSDIHQDIIIEE